MKSKRVKKTLYEWKLELIDKHDDIVDNDFEDNLSEHDGFMWRQFIEGPQAGPVKEGDNIVRYNLCLTRKYYSYSPYVLANAVKQGFEANDLAFYELEDISYAYIENGKLPEFFNGGNKVPQRFHREISKLKGD